MLKWQHFCKGIAPNTVAHSLPTNSILLPLILNYFIYLKSMSILLTPLASYPFHSKGSGLFNFVLDYCWAKWLPKLRVVVIGKPTVVVIGLLNVVSSLGLLISPKNEFRFWPNDVPSLCPRMCYESFFYNYLFECEFSVANVPIPFTNITDSADNLVSVYMLS